MSVSIQGLSTEQATERQARGLSNTVSFKTGRTYLEILRKNFFTFINTILFAISLILVLMGQVDDALVTAGLVLLNAVVGAYQESLAKYKLDRLALQVRSKANVIRSGVEQLIDPDEIVFGDIVVCKPGDQILADGHMVGDGRITVDESNLTGESERIYKRAGDPVYSGSYCTAGSGLYEAESIGAESQLNRLTVAARAFRQKKTPLQRDIDTIIRILVVLVSLLGLLLGIANFLSREPVVEFIRVAAVIVTLVPQGLFFMTTAAYGMGILRVAGKGALIQEANAVESTSHVNMLCLDKTGTLTTNRLQLAEVIVLNNPSLEKEALLSALGDFAVNMGTDDRTLVAIQSAAAGEKKQVSEKVPFSSEHKWSALRYASNDDSSAYVLGAPDVIATKITAKEKIMEIISPWVRQGQRVLLFASSPVSDPLLKSDGTPQLPETLDPLGLVVFQEELRPDVHQTINHFADLGVEIKIISGDHPETVKALSQQAGLKVERILSGKELEDINDGQLEKIAHETTIFGRMTPQQKERLIVFFRNHGYYTAMIGDGVNDILPLKYAHLGVAMQSGASATRSIADIVLLGDRFSALPAALQEGRRIVCGMQDVIRLLVTRTLYVLLLIVATQLARAPFPVTPKHNALIALLTVGLPILALAAWAKAGQSPGRMIRAALRFILPAAVTIASLVAGVYLVYVGLTNDPPLARTALTVTSIFCGLLLLPFVEPPNSWWVAGDELSEDWRPSLLAIALLVLFALIMGSPALRKFFELTPLHFTDYLFLGGLVCMWALLQRWIWRKHLFERLLGLGQTT